VEYLPTAVASYFQNGGTSTALRENRSSGWLGRQFRPLEEESSYALKAARAITVILADERPAGGLARYHDGTAPGLKNSADCAGEHGPRHRSWPLDHEGRLMRQDVGSQAHPAE
jgi:hypothetical protein